MVTYPLFSLSKSLESIIKPYKFWSRYAFSARGSGFPLIESKTLAEILEDPQYAEILEGLRAQLLRLLKDGVELGLLRREEAR